MNKEFSKDDYDTLIRAALTRLDECESVEDVINVEKHTAGELWATLSEILSPYKLSKAERDLIKVAASSAQLNDDLGDAPQDEKENSVNAVLMYMRHNGGKYYDAIRRTYALKEKYRVEAMEALNSEGIRPEIKEIVKNLYTKFDALYFIKNKGDALYSLYTRLHK